MDDAEQLAEGSTRPSARRHRRSSTDFVSGASRAPYKRTWNAGFGEAEPDDGGGLSGDEGAGADADAPPAKLLISCLDDCMSKLPAWIRHVTLVLDNAQINKNQFVVNWLLELVRSQRFKSARLILMVPGHTKFSPDELFARLSHTYYRQDVFLLSNLHAITARYGEATSLDATSIMLWKDQLSKAYKSIPDIKQQRDFLVEEPSPGHTTRSGCPKHHTFNHRSDANGFFFFRTLFLNTSHPIS